MIIYKTTNLLNNKIYIGQDSKNNSNYLGSGLLLQRAINKYGIENFKKEILEYCNSKDELNEKEKYWIKHFDSTDPDIGYNISPGGQGGIICNLEKLKGENYYLNKMSSEEKETHLNTYRRGINYWKSRGFNSLDEIENWIKLNWCGENHSHKKGKTEEEYQNWLDENMRGNNFWLNKLSSEDRQRYIEKNYKGKNNPIFKNKTEEEIEEWLNNNRRGKNAPNAKYIYTITTNNGEIIITECLKDLCKERNFNLHTLMKFIEVSEGKREKFIPRQKEYIGWKVSKVKRR